MFSTKVLPFVMISSEKCWCTFLCVTQAAIFYCLGEILVGGFLYARQILPSIERFVLTAHQLTSLQTKVSVIL